MTMRISSLRQAGGVNSLDNFARSWSRAAAFPEIAPTYRESVIVDDDDEPEIGSRVPDHETHVPHTSLIRQQIEGYPQHDSPLEEASIEDEDFETRERAPLDDTLPSSTQDDSHLSPPIGYNYGTSYGSVSSRLNGSPMRHAAELFRERHGSISRDQDKEIEPLLVKQVQREDGTKAEVVIGQSTLPQTVFNSVNVLIGVGLLSLPLAVKFSGWVLGMVFLAFAALSTAYTARLLALCLDVDPSLVTYADIAYISFGPRARILTSLLFSLELVAACVALVVLFADSLDALVGGWSVLGWKIFCGLILIPLNFIPLRLLSVTSILGILCAFGSKFTSLSTQEVD